MLALAGVVVPAGSASASDPGFLIRARNSNKCLDVVGGATYNGARIQQWDCNGSPQQRWFMHMDSKGDYLIVNVNSGKCLDVQAASKSNGAPLQQWDCNGEKHQRFFIHDQERIVPTHDFSKCLDVTGGPDATGNGVRIQQWTCLSNYPTNQSFY
jgi:ricin-type beta-trefoil lectin protein